MTQQFLNRQRCQRTAFSAGQERNTRWCYFFSGGIFLIAAENTACLTESTGLCFIVVLAGSFPRKLSPCQFLAGLIGRGTNPPPQFGQTLYKTFSTQAAQKVHS